ncbi:LysE/ArgO family amino acid transporter [Bacillus sp. NEB1478]|uniref:LysE/ArgO family amino acid transporter n=1 Tax=Bacillus sp. NEB1478 TaxID=3073816 RepID=UPI0028737E56|nr:LysE/ArgO family amino acid transporter [Bacillus sp. NEB1478]WNB93961.1 LysE/ArgO family amino acid transporter [Bacillus sp. NEB1478]
MQSFLHGVILAIGLILPLGVQNVFVFNQGAQQPNVFRSMPAVLTASVCDTLLIVLAVSGVSAFITALDGMKLAIMLIGILFLLYMGWEIWSSKTKTMGDQMTMSLKQQIGFAATVSLLNPHAILDTVAVIGTSSAAYTGTEKTLFMFACICVSWFWFIGLAITGRLVGTLDSSGRIQMYINKGSAIMIWGIALYLMISLNYL